ncbi:branched-chain amino acid ABC transporter permease [Denitromonas iodatirespirans]|uniref:Branched-chain amino acid ABC transporter permease n=1 Tax=Denitromonas iodatirespirans TaxID=2795389 RepID=A0A944H984_DENI1|nr:branched-chain amino acid ABC transporter permease [Denitromonas iodatirespirans]MBT0962170.1 branched-chain amino acid ABC transporter permease [Denitromonas iodatirespirans]
MTTIRPSTLIPLLLLAALAVLPFAAESYYTAFFARVLIYAVAASALNLALGMGGMVSLGHALFLGLGMYSVALPAHFGIDDGWLQLALCVAACGLVGLVTGAISLRTSGIAFIMITLAFAQMGYFLVVSLKQFGGDDGLPIAGASRFFGLELASAEAVYGAAFCLLLALTAWVARLRVSPFGMTLRAGRQNARRVASVGLALPRYQLAAYVLSAVLCGLAGMLLANLNAYASPSSMSWMVSGELIVMVVLGGMGSVFGPLLGALAFLGIEELLKGLTEHWMAIFGLLILAVALLGKSGIAGLLARLDARVPARRSPRLAEGRA